MEATPTKMHHFGVFDNSNKDGLNQSQRVTNKPFEGRHKSVDEMLADDSLVLRKD